MQGVLFPRVAVCRRLVTLVYGQKVLTCMTLARFHEDTNFVRESGNIGNILVYGEDT